MTAHIEHPRNPAAVEPIPTETAPKRHLSWWIWGAVLIVAAGVVVQSLATNPLMDWGVVGRYLFDPQILAGLLHTLLLAVVSTAGSILLGIVFGFLRLAQNPALRWFGAVYVWVFRSVPTLIQILFWGNMALFVATIRIGIPGTPIVWASIPTNSVFSPLTASVMALAVANGAYFAEIVRSGILSVDDRYRRAADALGLNWWQVQRKVVLPISIRVMLPPSGSQFITILKETTLVSVIGGGDLLNIVQTIYGNNFRTIELLIVAAIWFLVVTSVAYVIQSALERRVGRGSQSGTTPSRTRSKQGSPSVALEGSEEP